MSISSGLLFLIILSGPAPKPDLCPLVAELNAAISQATGYVPAPCPDIGFSALPEAGALRSQAGAYFPQTGNIELARDLDLTQPYGQSYLLHELVHAAQYANGAQTKVRCPESLEAEAYMVQAGFLRAHGMGREAMMMTILANQLGGCAD